MRKDVPAISNQIYKDSVLNIIDKHYSVIGPMWTSHQIEWINGVYKSFKNHDKYLIVIYLIKKTLDFYSRSFTKFSFDEFYLKDTVEIEKFNIKELSINLKIPKESARRKVLELQRDGILKKKKQKIILDRSAYAHTKPTNSIRRISRFLATLSKVLLEEKILQKKIESEDLEKILKKNFSYFWKLYYEFQIPMMLGYKNFFGDIESAHIWAICVVNQHLFIQKKNDTIKRSVFFEYLYSNETQGINAMSISDITGIPRATVVRKLKKMLKLKNLKIDSKKHYTLTENFLKKLIPIQHITLVRLADFSAKVYNLVLLTNKNLKQELEVPIYSEFL
jgi:hypothetical protein